MGCFWCSENLFMKMKGVHCSMVGYAGGNTPNPTYEEVCSGQTNHNEVVRVIYDPNILTFRDILEKTFWPRHDPTTPMQQGGDCGTQYRSEIYVSNDEEKEIAEETLKAFQAKIDSKFGVGSKKICTGIVDANKTESQFYFAELYHQQYDAKPGSRQYCGLRPLNLN